jgi:hypothetical protein
LAPVRAAEPPGELRVATFAADVTPRLGEGPCIGFMPQVLRVEHPLYAKGVVLTDAGGTYVLCALDYVGVCNDTYDLFRKTIAAAAGTAPGRVAVQSLHQHTAPCLDANGQQLLYRDKPVRLSNDLEFAAQTAGKVADAVREAAKKTRRVTHVGTSRAKVERVASNRRVVRPDGSIAVRLSACKDPLLRQAPEGLIDPWLRTITFFDGGARVAQLHYYATHPQSFYGDGRITYDVPGIARERLEKESKVFQVHFTGCGGNVAMGKYNDGTPAARAALSERLYEAMARAAAHGERQPVTRIAWTTKAVEFPPRTEPEFSADACRKVLGQADKPFPERLKAAMLLAWIERVRSGRAVELSCLALGGVKIVHLPGEPFVEFQLAAQKAVPDSFVAVAGYGDCPMWYYGPDRIYTDRGGYEQTWSFTGPCERRINDAVAELLSVQPPR